jgi:hypothetical protein
VSERVRGNGALAAPARRAWRSALVAIVLAALVASLVAAPTAGAAAVRSEFFGIVQASTLDNSDLQGMKAIHVRTVRYLFPWYSVEPKNGSFAWSRQDKFIGRLAARGIRAVPTVWGTPHWVNGDYIAHLPVDHPKDIGEWQTFLKAVVKRYGPNGFYWTHGYRDQYGPNATPLPMTAYQIWNEPNLRKYNTPYPAPRRYGQLVVASHNAIKGADPKAQIILGGMPATGDVKASDFLGQLYNQVPGIKNDFDAAALHPYASTISGVQNAIVRLRTVMKNHGDATAPLWISEIAWGSAPPDSRGINKGPQGQAKMLTDAYRLILNHRAAWNVQRLFWYHWRDPFKSQASCTFCSSAALLRNNRTKKPAYNAFRAFSADITPPNASITAGPAQGSTTNDPTPTFRFTSSQAGSTFECHFDARAFMGCSSPFTPKAALANGAHRFWVKAIDAAGNVSTPISRSFTVSAP